MQDYDDLTQKHRDAIERLAAECAEEAFKQGLLRDDDPEHREHLATEWGADRIFCRAFGGRIEAALDG